MKYSPAWSRVAVKPTSRQIHTATRVVRATMLFISEFLHWSVEPKVCLSRAGVRGGLVGLKMSYKIMRGNPEYGLKGLQRTRKPKGQFGKGELPVSGVTYSFLT